ncbi:CPXCG motif-containing cysteine-rich protein [Methylobacter sp. S3L5C]|uniref:CPXCG motif-containing cysteine-rich protein n=1 Tax=Methylobacter sp. S3L5C TaxID=2839024 RepID=UPI001FABF975|nr:CPXCG motif-containing cysteine-rich protein [Methylobacter sp. S3L5C]UOA09726.1 CPXCG motif-containing cysteine-rich protein [Methylobacter sp. S3L5C]
MQDLDEIIIYCPYCGEALDALIDTSAGAQQYYEDCAVCCAPILFTVSEDHTGELVIDVKRDDE